MRWLDSITDSMDMNLGKLCEMLRNRETDMGTSGKWAGPCVLRPSQCSAATHTCREGQS